MLKVLFYLLIVQQVYSQSFEADNLQLLNNTNVRWTFNEPIAIGDFCQVSGNGKYGTVGWNYSNKRISLYGNKTSGAIWDFDDTTGSFFNYVAISDTGVVAGASHHNIYLFNNSDNTPFFNYDLTLLPDTGIATSLDITSDSKFLIASASRTDTSTIFGFNSGSTIPVWTLRIVPLIVSGGPDILGVKISGNDSVVIINTFAEIFVIRTYTGQLIFRTPINPTSPDLGSQAIQGINGDGSIIAIINITGLLRVMQWNGSTYNLLWANQEPQGQNLDIFTAVDVTYDGEYIAAGTLNFLNGGLFDGKVRLFAKSGSGVPLWSFQGCGDIVTSLSFSKSGNILTASSFGNQDLIHPTEDLYIFKTFLGNIPIFKLHTPGSLFYCGTSSDGRMVIASGKAVHARESGFGGLVYNIDVDTSDVPLSITPLSTDFVTDYKLHQNYPNPFNPVTKIKFEIPQGERNGLQSVTLVIYNSLGKEIETLVNEQLQPGSYEVTFESVSLSSGIYFYKLQSEQFVQTRKMILLK